MKVLEVCRQELMSLMLVLNACIYIYVLAHLVLDACR